MADGSDAIADWPLLNAMVNVASRRLLGVDPPRRRRRHRPLDPRRPGHASPTAPPLAGAEARAGADQRPGHGRHPARRRRLRPRRSRSPTSAASASRCARVNPHIDVWTHAGAAYRIESEGRDPSPAGEEEAVKTKAAVVYEPGKPIEIEELDLDGPQGRRGPDPLHPRGPVPLRRARRPRRPRGPAADGARPRGRRDHRGGRARRHPGQGRRPRRLLVHPELRHLPLVRDRPAGDLRHGRDDPRGLPARRRASRSPGPTGEYGAMCMLGTFSQYGDHPPELAWSRSTTTCRWTRPCSSAAACPPAGARRSTPRTCGPARPWSIFGVGGIGINAVQGARYAGAKNVIAVDPLENKREKAMELGATHAFASAEEAQSCAQPT